MPDLLESALAGRYVIERELGKGGMGAVYLAQDLRLQRPVAIKVLPPELAVREELRERFLRETRTAAAFSHPNIVPVHAVEEHAELLCFVMGYVDGETLTQRVRRAGPLSAPDLTRLLQEVAWALSYAHGRGIVHRDIKPDNILIERATSRALVTDFGIARSTETATSALTQVGQVIGTPQFMSPEQAAGEALDGRSDLYSLGVVGFFAATGRLPFDAASAAAVLAMQLTQAPAKVASLRPDLPAPLCAVIDRCLEKDPASRFQTGEAMAAALDALRASRPEIAPTLRLFQAQTVQALRAVVLILLFELMLVARPLGLGSGDVIIPGVIGAAVIWGIIAQMVQRARVLLRAGFSHADVIAGLHAILAERQEAHEEEVADPAIRKRLGLRRRIIIAGGLYGVLGWIWVFRRMRVRTGPTQYTISLPGSIILISCAVMIGLSLALMVMNSSRAAAIDRLSCALWNGSFGRWIFRLGRRRMQTGRNAPQPAVAATASSSPLSVIAELPTGLRRELRASRTRIQRIEASLHALATRQRDLEAAIADARGGAQATDPALRARHGELIEELVQARDAVIANREQVAGALENVRLQLLRVRGGVGSHADVAAEVQAAEALVT